MTDVQPSSPLEKATVPLAIVLMGMYGYATKLVAERAVLAGDPAVFRDRVAPMFEGSLPYFDTVYEHFPLSLPPMLLPRLLPGGTTTAVYTLGFGALMAACLILTAVVVRKVASADGVARGDTIWLAYSAPLIPLVVFRVDPVATLLVVGGFYLSFVTVKRAALPIELAAIAAKGFPVVLAPVEWWAGRRRRGAILFAFTVVLAGGLLLTPGFQEGRDFSGVHMETVAGSTLLWLRSLLGAELGLFGAAGALYIEAPRAVLLVGAALSGLVLWSSRSMWKRRTSVRNAAQAVGVLTLALLLLSPLLSAQFLLWLTPWLVFFNSGRSQRLFLAAGGVTMVLLLHWVPSNFLWQTGLLLRNALLLAMAGEMVREVLAPDTSAAVPAASALETA